MVRECLIVLVVVVSRDARACISIRLCSNTDCLFPPESNFDGADFTNAVVDRASFTGSSLRGTIFGNTVLTGTSFTDADVENADFTDAYIGGK